MTTKKQRKYLIKIDGETDTDDNESLKDFFRHRLRTGDQFVLFENGYGKVVGRLKEMIIRGGENLFPREIEDFLNTHPEILETHVVSDQFFMKIILIF